MNINLRAVLALSFATFTSLSGTAFGGCPYEEVKKYQSQMNAAKFTFETLAKTNGYRAQTLAYEPGNQKIQQEMKQAEREMEDAQKSFRSAEKALYEKCGIMPR